MPNYARPPRHAVEDYLKAIHELGREWGSVSTSALAERLGLTAGSVSAMLRRLDEQGLVVHTPYRGVRLTRRGRRVALETIRHHRLLELYLREVVGMPWDRVHEEADALEHVISEELEARLDELLGHPTRDPHGHPIPSPALELPDERVPPLQEANRGARCAVRWVSDRDPALLRHLAQAGVVPGAELEVVEHVPFGGGVRIRVGAREHVLGPEAAAAVFVEGSL